MQDMKKSRTPEEVQEILARGRKLVALAHEKMAQFEKELEEGRKHTAAYVEHLRRTRGEGAVQDFQRRAEQARAQVEAEMRRERMHGNVPAAAPKLSRVMRGTRV